METWRVRKERVAGRKERGCEIRRPARKGAPASRTERTCTRTASGEGGGRRERDARHDVAWARSASAPESRSSRRLELGVTERRSLLPAAMRVRACEAPAAARGAAGAGGRPGGEGMIRFRVWDGYSLLYTLYIGLDYGLKG